MRVMMATVVLVLLTAAGAAGQALDQYVAEMHGAFVIPPVDGSGNASMMGFFDSAGSCGQVQFDSFRVYIEYRQLSGDPTGMYIHRGGFPANGERLYTLAEGYFERGTLPGAYSIDSADCDDMDNIGLYVVITTAAHPDGEVRGQIEYLPFQPVEQSTWGRVRRTYQ